MTMIGYNELIRDDDDEYTELIRDDDDWVH